MAIALKSLYVTIFDTVRPSVQARLCISVPDISEMPTFVPVCLSPVPGIYSLWLQLYLYLPLAFNPHSDYLSLISFWISDFRLCSFCVWLTLLKSLCSPSSIFCRLHPQTAHSHPGPPASGLSYSQLHQKVWGDRPFAENSHALDMVFWTRRGYLLTRETACDLHIWLQKKQKTKNTKLRSALELAM